MSVFRNTMFIGSGGIARKSPPVLATSAALTQWNTNVTSHLVPVPAGTNSGDLLLVFIGTGAFGRTVVNPAGWTKAGSLSSDEIYCAYKVSAGSEPATIDFTTSIATRVTAQMHRITGASATQPDVFVSSGVFNAQHTSETSPAATPLTLDALVFTFCSMGLNSVNGTWTTTAGSYTLVSSTAGLTTTVGFDLYKQTVTTFSTLAAFTHSWTSANGTTAPQGALKVIIKPA